MTDFINVSVLRGFTEIAKIYEITSSTNSFICGGYVRYMCAPVFKPIPAGDVDIFSQDQDGFEYNKALFQQQGYTIKHENNISVTLQNPEDCFTPTVQLIKPVNQGHVLTTGDMEKILRNFDFTVVRIGLLNPSTALADIDFLEDEKHHTLRFKNIHCPISSLLRANKYAKKGYYLRPIEALKLFSDWEGRDDKYRLRIKELFETSLDVDEEGKSKLTQQEIDELEALLRID